MKLRQIVMFIFIIGLVGCDNPIEQKLEEKAWEESELEQDEDFERYRKLDKEDKLNDDGSYKDTEVMLQKEGNEQEHKQVHVTFAENKYLTINYFSDMQLTEPINTVDCYLDPLDRIYISLPESKNPYTKEYEVKEFVVYEHGKDGKRIGELYRGGITTNLVYHIPKNFKGTEISIVPHGGYKEKKVLLQTYYINAQGKKKELAAAGIWNINGEECKKNSIKLNPIESYTIDYKYDKQNYFFVDSKPKCFNYSENSGIVKFNKYDFSKENKMYLIELHPYLNLTIELDEKGKLKRDGKEDEIKKKKSIIIANLKYGDTFVIETKGSCKITDGNYNNVKASKDPIQEGNRYTFTITKEIKRDGLKDLEKIAEVEQSVTVELNSKCKYGECVYYIDGKEVEGIQTIKKDEKLKIKYKITNKKYKFKDKNFFARKNSVTISIKELNDCEIIYPDDYFEIVEKG